MISSGSLCLYVFLTTIQHHGYPVLGSCEEVIQELCFCSSSLSSRSFVKQEEEVEDQEDGQDQEDDQQEEDCL